MDFTTVPERGWIRNTVAPSSLVTHTAPTPAASAVGFAPMSIRAVAAPRARSIRDDVRSASEATQSAPNPAAMPRGALPAAILRTSRFAAGADLRHRAGVGDR